MPAPFSRVLSRHVAPSWLALCACAPLTIIACQETTPDNSANLTSNAGSTGSDTTMPVGGAANTTLPTESTGGAPTTAVDTVGGATAAGGSAVVSLGGATGIGGAMVDMTALAGASAGGTMNLGGATAGGMANLAGAAAGGTANLAGAAAGGAATGGTSAGGTGGMANLAGAAAGGEGGAGGSGVVCDTSPGMAIQFSGNAIDNMTANIGADGPSGDEPRTLELWAKFLGDNSWTAERSVIELGRRVDAGNQVWGIDMSGRSGNGGRFGPYTNGVSDNNGSAGPLLDVAGDVGWLHLSWAYEGGGGELVFTVNGEQLPTEDPGSNFTLDLTPGIITLGASQSFGPAEGWDGVMDEVRVWTVYRSPTEIAADMNVFLKGDEPGLAAYYNFDDSDGSYVDDVLGTASHRLQPCTATDDRCTAVNTAAPTIIASDIPGAFTCSP